MTSAADIEVPSKFPAQRPDQSDDNHLIEDMRALREACGPTANKNDQASVVIQALIEQGYNTKSRVIGAMMRVDFDRGHAASVLEHGAGSDPKRYRWWCDPSKIYRLHNA